MIPHGIIHAYDTTLDEPPVVIRRFFQSLFSSRAHAEQKDAMNTFQSHNGFNIPPLINPPIQIFGATDENGSPIQPDFPGGPYFTEDHSDLGLEDGNEAKRRRIARVTQLFTTDHTSWLRSLRRLVTCAGKRR